MKPIPSFWQKAQQKIRRRINFTLWGEYFLPFLFLLSALAALLFYLFRRWNENPLWAGLALIPLMAGLAFYAYSRLKEKFFTRQDTLAFLDDRLKLNTRLSLANSGKGDWPEKQQLGPCLEWRSPLPFILWPLASLVLIILSLSIPLPASSTTPPYSSAPPALEQVEKWMEGLTQMKELDQEKLEELEEKVESLIERPKEDMYTHSALEAAESLKEQMDQEMKEFAQNLKRFQDALSSAPSDASAQNNNNKASEESLKSALEAMDGKNLQLSREALNPSKENKGNNGNSPKQGTKSGKEFSRDKMSQMSADQKQKLKEMAQRAKEQLEALNEALKNNNGNCDGSMGNDGNGDKGNKNGGGPAPLALGKTAPEINMEKEDLLSDPNAEITLGEKLGEESGIFDVQDDGKRASSAGKAGNPSSGGQATWEEQYTPEEKDALKNFFK